MGSSSSILLVKGSVVLSEESKFVPLRGDGSVIEKHKVSKI